MTDIAADITLRRATPADAATLAALGATTFTETFGHLYSPRDLQAFLEESHSTAAWARILDDSARAVWTAQRADGTPIAFVAAGACKLPVEPREPAAGEIQMLYVRKPYQNLRLGARLMDTALAWLAECNRAPLYVGVWSENQGAQRFYARYGFSKVGEYGFPVGATVDREFILKRQDPLPGPLPEAEGAKKRS